MLDYFEVYKVDADFDWIEVKAADSLNQKPTIIRMVIGDGKDMVFAFVKRYMAKQDRTFTVSDSQIQLMEEFFVETDMARVLARKGADSPDLVELLPTTMIHFKYPERTSFRKSRAARISLFQEQAFAAVQRRDFEEAMVRLNWIHLLDPGHELAFELKVVCLRSWKKMPETIAVFEDWITAYPNHIEPRLGLSEMWLYLDQNQRAKESFRTILESEPNHPMALVGQAQAKLKLGEDPIPDLRKAWVLDQDFVRDMVERHFDFRRAHPGALEARTLTEIAKSFHIPIKRVLERARHGVLPAHSPNQPDGLLRFCPEDLELHYEILRCLGLEIASGQLTGTSEPAERVAADQPGLFEERQRRQDLGPKSG